MLAVFPFCHKDIEQMLEVMRWIGELEPSMPRHSALLIASKPAPEGKCLELARMARKIFGNFSMIRQRVEDERGWPQSCNSLFRIAVQASKQSAFWWNEADCIPLKKGWLDALEAEYRAAGKPIMGARFDKPWPHITGCAVYPPHFEHFNAQAIQSDTQPWDVANAEATLRHSHVTSLIQHVWDDPETGSSSRFPNLESLSNLSSKAVVFHRCKDNSLITALRDNPNFVPTDTHVEPVLSPLTSKAPKDAEIKNVSYYHSGNLGDIVYGLCAVMLAGGGKLIVGPTQVNTAGCSNPVVKAQYELLKPLLDVQPYLSGFSFSQTHVPAPVVDLNVFRNHWCDLNCRIKHGINSLCHMHCHRLGVGDFFTEDTTWLSVPAPDINDRIIVARSLRHRDWFFPWKKVISRYGKKLLFIGHREEHERFQMAWGDIEYRPVADFLEMARVIAGARAFIGNQSFPCSLAIGIGATVLQEVYDVAPDCLFKRDNFFTKETLDGFNKYV